MAMHTSWFGFGPLAGSPLLQRTVAEILETMPAMVSPETEVAEALRLAEMTEAHYLPVVTNLGEALGVVCRCDLRRSSPGVRVGTVVRRPAFTISERASPEQAAETMLEMGVGCLPVLDDFTVVGMVTRAELLRAQLLSTQTAPACSLCDALEHVAAAEAPALPVCRRCREDGTMDGLEELETGDERELGGGD